VQLGLTLGLWSYASQFVPRGSSGAPGPVLTLTSGSTVNVPTFSIAFDDLLPAGSVISFQSAGDPSFSTPTTTNHTVTIAEALANTIALSLSPLADGTYYFRINATIDGVTKPWSNVVSETIAAVPTLSSPLGAKTGQTTASLSVTTDRSGGTLYWVVSTSATPPTAAQIEAGHDSTGSAGAASGNQSVSSGGSQVISGGATGLTSNTTYHLYFVHQNSVGPSNVAAASAFVTDSTLPTVSFIGTLVPSGGGSSVLSTSAANIGVASTHRRVICIMSGVLDAGNGGAPSSATINGVAADVFELVSGSTATGTDDFAIVSAVVPTGTTGVNITTNWTGGQQAGVMAIYTVNDSTLLSPNPTFAFHEIASGVIPAISITAAAGGFAITSAATTNGNMVFGATLTGTISMTVDEGNEASQNKFAIGSANNTSSGTLSATWAANAGAMTAVTGVMLAVWR